MSTASASSSDSRSAVQSRMFGVEVRRRRADARTVDADDPQVRARSAYARASSGICRRAPGVPCIQTIAGPRREPYSAKLSRRPSADRDACPRARDARRLLMPSSVTRGHARGRVRAGPSGSVHGGGSTTLPGSRTAPSRMPSPTDQRPVDDVEHDAGDVVPAPGDEGRLGEHRGGGVRVVAARSTSAIRTSSTRSVSPSLHSSSRSPGGRRARPVDVGAAVGIAVERRAARRCATGARRPRRGRAGRCPGAPGRRCGPG